MVKTIIATIFAYSLTSYMMLGSIIGPILLLAFGRDRLALPDWNLLILAAILVAGGVFAILMKKGVPAWCSVPVFVVLSTVLSAVSIGTYVDHERSERIAQFNPDMVFQHSFLQSAGRGSNAFSLHAGAMKGCVPYAWSYRTMTFYELEADTAVNVLPNAWLERCEIHRTR